MRLLGIVVLASCLSAADWNQFRGPAGSGVYSGTAAPLEFGVSKNVAWKVALPPGKSSPVFAGTRIFLTAQDGEKLVTLALDAKTGSELWRRDLLRDRTARRHKLNHAAAPSPVAGHRGVYSFFPDFGVVAYSSDGKERWRLPLSPMESMHGVSASPVLHCETLILVCDHASGSFILAIDTKTGNQQWRKSRPDSVTGLYASPAIYAPKGVEPQVVVLGDSEVASYSIDSGDRLWWLPGLPIQLKSSPVVSNDVVYLACRQLGEGVAIPSFDQALKSDKNTNGALEQPETAGPVNSNFNYIDTNQDGSIDRAEWNELKRVFEIPGAALAIRPNARGELSPKSVLWRVDKGLPEVPTPLYYQGVVFLLRNGGILTAIDGTTGAVTKQGRITVGGGAYNASPIAAAGHLYLASESGRVSIVKAAPEWEPVADIDLNEEIYATPAVVNGNLYVRTMFSLYCFTRPYLRGNQGPDEAQL